MKKLLFISVLIFIQFQFYGQEWKNILADDLLIRQKVKDDPSLIDKYQAYEKKFKLLVDQCALQNWMSKTDTLINGKRIIPVVVHIIHNYGAENITDAQVIDAINKMNIDYLKLNADTAQTYPLFKSRAANCAIEFRLAKLDSNGNCTNGIDHIYDPQTNWAYFSTMKQYHWPTDKYMNVFAVNFIYPSGMSLPDGAFIGGMSPFPPDNTLSQALTGGDPDIDGVLIRQDCMGAIGTAENVGGMGINMLNRTFTHETGHYFNLYHPFQSLYAALGIDGCGNIIFSAGDEVDDTPPVAAATQNTSLTCFTPGSINSCTNDNPDEPDMIENYMDYQWGYCNNIFTNGQKARMDATLTGYRHNLWSKENLIATGVLDTAFHPLCTPIADFHASNTTVCVGSTVSFYDNSYNGTVDTYQWDFPGGTPSTSNVAAPVITYNTAGIYPATITVSNTTGTDTKTMINYIKVIDPSTNLYAPMSEGFENGLNSEWYVTNDIGNGWVISDTASATGAKSIRILNFTGNQPASIDAFVSNGLNLTSLSTSVALKLKFKYAYAGKINPGTILTAADTVYDKLRVMVSTNCGKTWVQRWIKSNANLQTTTPTSSSFKPLSTEWKADSINIHIYLTQHQTNFQFKFEFIPNGGNNVYVDDINIDNGAYVNMNEYALDLLDVKLYPNPMNQSTTLYFNLPESNYTRIDVYDMLGHEVMNLENSTLNAGTHYYYLSKNDFSSNGCYFIRITAGEFSFVQQLMVE